MTEFHNKMATRTQLAAGFAADNRLTRPVSSPSAAPGFPIRLLFVVFLILSFPAFTLQLAMNLNTGMWTGSPILKVATISSEVFAFAVMFSSREIKTFVFKCWPIWVLISIAFISAVWSINPNATIHEANTYMASALLGLVLVGALPGFQCVRFCIRVMVLGCVLSIAWIVLFPKIGVTQATDIVQSVHAGDWRGVFSHKQGLGVFAGLTVGLLLFYRTMIFSLPLFVSSFVCSAACLIGTRSATGFVIAVFTPVALYVGYSVARCPLAARKGGLFMICVGVLAVAISYKFGLMNFVIVHILDKSTDLTGRTDIWPIVEQNFRNSGRTLLGGGYGAFLGSDLAEGNSVDNGYLDLLIEFGYLSSPIVFGTFIAILWGAIRLILTTPSKNAMTSVFPLGVWSAILFLNITESDFMTKCIETILTSIAIGLIIQQQMTQTRVVRSEKSARVGH